MKKRTLVPWSVVARLLLVCFAVPFFMHLSAQKNTDKTSTVADTPAHFPGGLPAWSKYLDRNQRADLLRSKGAPPGTYKVTVSFLVDERGNLSDIHGLNDPGFGAKAEAERLIQKGPNWIPAKQNGHVVKYRHKQEIAFRIKG